MRLSSFRYVALPNRRRAAARASFAVMPDSICSSCRNSRCRRISSSRSASNCRRCLSMLRRLTSSRSQSIAELLLDRLDHARDRSDDAFKLRHFYLELFASRRRQLVIASPAVSSRRAPLRGHPTLDQHPLQRGVQGAFFNLKNVIRYSLNGIGDLIPMHFAGARQRSQNQQIERSGRNFVSMQSITPDVVRLCQCRMVSSLCQESAGVAALPKKHTWEAEVVG